MPKRKQIPQVSFPMKIIEGYSNVKPKNTLGIWNPEEDKMLFELYFERNEKIKAISSVLGRSKVAVAERARVMRLCSEIKPLTSNWVNNNLQIRNFGNYQSIMHTVRHAAKLGLITYQLC